MVAVRAVEARDEGAVEGVPAVLAHGEGEARLVDPVVVRGVDGQGGEVERADLDVERAVDLLPAFAEVVGAVEGGVPGFDERVHHARPGRRHGDGDPPLVALRQAVFDLAPGLAAVRALPQAAPLAAGAEEAGAAAEGPEAGIEDARLLRIDRQIGAAGVGVDGEDALPGLAAVGRLVDAAVRAGIPQRSGGADPGGVGARRADLDAGDALGLVEPEVGPALSPVGRPVDAVADRHAVARPRLAGADPDVLRIAGIDADGADRLNGIVEDRLEGRPAVHGLPDTAAGRSDVDGERIVGDGVDRGDAAAGHRGTDGTGFEPAESERVDLDLRGGRRARAQYQVDRQARGQAEEPPRGTPHGFAAAGLAV